MKNRVKEIRKIKGLSQTQLADACGTSLRNIQFIEKGERGLETWFDKISQVLGVPGWQLIADPEDVYPSGEKAIVSAYLSLEADDRKIVDKFLFPEKNQFSPSDDPLMPVPTFPKGPTKEKR